ncbi:hypothetical protein [Prevotella intermedia]|uniref:Uncharacterized protein n=1 Tax=Prevotella intermedia TaxID=28131 RepID=A0A3R8G5I2_PREIN|nr:hypothetical protein [Prevotella intermedia]RQE02979.1 hypothetical protein D2S53_08240 [Prevotella intermedia]RRF86982.1 hypothetical protein D2S45_08490 [Prevotella intermedia]
MKKEYIKLQMECIQMQYEGNLLEGSGNDHADSKEFKFDFDAEFDNFDDDEINTLKDKKNSWDY